MPDRVEQFARGLPVERQFLKQSGIVDRTRSLHQARKPIMRPFQKKNPFDGLFAKPLLNFAAINFERIRGAKWRYEVLIVSFVVSFVISFIISFIVSFTVSFIVMFIGGLLARTNEAINFIIFTEGGCGERISGGNIFREIGS